MTYRSPFLFALLLSILTSVHAGCASAYEAREADANIVEPTEDFAACAAIETNEKYVCPYREAKATEDFIFTKVLSGGAHAVYAGRSPTTALVESPIVGEPPGWSIRQLSIAPDREHILVTALSPTCATDWPNPAGESCTWGRGTLWLLSHQRAGEDGLTRDRWVYTNVSTLLGKNSTIVGWTTWLNRRLAIFNAKAAPPGVPLVTGPHDATGFAYAIDLSGPAPVLRRWGEAAGVNDDKCFVGRMHASGPSRTDACDDGQVVVITRRCFDEAVQPSTYSWFNTANDDGSGDACHPAAGPAELVPVFRVYAVKLGPDCEPKSFDRRNPIRDPDYAGHWRHMGAGREWGDGQSTVSADGKWVAFWSQRGFDFAAPTDNCEAFASRDGSIGNGAARVRYCELDAQMRCKETLTLAPGVDPWAPQGHAYFHRSTTAADVQLLVSEGPSAYLYRSQTMTRTLAIAQGGGGHPIAP
jgi:hypothetical protein